MGGIDGAGGGGAAEADDGGHKEDDEPERRTVNGRSSASAAALIRTVAVLGRGGRSQSSADDAEEAEDSDDSAEDAERGEPGSRDDGCRSEPCTRTCGGRKDDDRRGGEGAEATEAARVDEGRASAASLESSHSFGVRVANADSGSQPNCGDGESREMDADSRVGGCDGRIDECVDEEEEEEVGTNVAGGIGESLLCDASNGKYGDVGGLRYGRCCGASCCSLILSGTAWRMAAVCSPPLSVLVAVLGLGLRKRVEALALQG